MKTPPTVSPLSESIVLVPSASPPSSVASDAVPALVLVVKSRGSESLSHPRQRKSRKEENPRVLLDYIRAEPSSPPDIEQALLRRAVQRRARLSRTARLYQWGVPPVAEERLFVAGPE